MLNNIIRYSITHKLVIGLLTLALIITGIYSLRQLPVDAVPDITNNQVQVITPSPTLAAQEVERLITFPIELTMATIPKIDEIRSFSRFGLSVVTIVFEENVDVYWARQQVNERLAEAQARIPESIGKPSIAPLTTGLGEIYQYVITTKPGYHDKYDAVALRTIQDWVIKRQLLGTKGVADVSSFGGYLKQYEIAVRPERLNAMKISISEIFSALETNNQNTGGAYIEKSDKAFFIRSEGLVGSIKDIENILVKQTDQGMPILISDVANVQTGKAIRYGATTRNGEGEVVSALVLMLKGANSAEVIKDVKERMAAISKTLPEGVVIEPFLDRTKLVDNAIGTVTTNLVEGALIVIFILLLLLGNWRAGLITASVIPLALLFAFSMMHLFGVSANLMSLGAIDFGLIVDGAVIIVEATLFHLGALNLKRKLTQSEMDEEVYQSASKIRNSAAFGEIIILIVYLPILALVGTEGKMFGPMAQTVSFAILGAFILSLTYIPMMSALVLNKNTAHGKKNISDRIMHFLYRLYEPILKGAMRTRAVVVASTIVLFIIAFIVFRSLGGEFIPTLEEGDFAVETRVITGSSLSNTIKATTKAEKIILDNFPEVLQVVTKIGSGEIPTDPMPVEAGDLMIILKDKSEWVSASSREELATKMAEALEVIPGVTFGFQQPIQMRFNELMTGVRQDVAVKIYGEDLEQLSKYASQIGKIAGTVDGAVDVYIEEVTGVPQIVIDYNRALLAKYGLDIKSVNSTIQAAFAGASAGLVYEGEKQFDLVVRLEGDHRASLLDVQNLYLNGVHGQQIPLQQVAKVSIVDGPYQIQRDNTHRRIITAFNVRNRDVESVVDEISRKIESEVKLAPGYSISYGGQFENLVKARQRLSIAVPMALLLIFILLYFTFGSIKQGVLIFTAIPLSAIGGVFALWLRDLPFSISAGVGFIALFGVAVLNGIVLIAEFNRLKKEGVSDVFERIYVGTKTRLRPVIMTAAVASLGFLPMAISQTSGAEVQRPLATVVIGGLITATFLTLIVLPILYYYSEKKLNMKTNKTVVLLFLSCFGSIYSINAQTSGVKIFDNLDAIIETALMNNPNIKISKLQTEQQQALKGTSFDIPKTQLGLDYGQTNSAVDNDTRFSVNQTFAFPTVYSNQSKLSKARIASSERNEALVKNEMIAQVKSAYYMLWYLKSKQNLLKRQDSIYQKFQYAADLRFKTGESNALEKATATAELADIKIAAQDNASMIKTYQSQLQNLIQSNSLVDINVGELEGIPALGLDESIDSLSVAKNPIVSYYQSKIEVADRERAVQSAKMLPDITLGYFNQSFIGSGETANGTPTLFDSGDRFTGVQLGLSIPVFFKSHTAKIKAAKIHKLEIESQLEAVTNDTKSELQTALQALKKDKYNMDFYQLNALPQAELLLKNSQRGFQEGEIQYIEYIQGLNRALTIQTRYLDYINQYNQTLITIEKLTTNN